jgi:carbon monoxide dehydrogenase subunit G
MRFQHALAALALLALPTAAYADSSTHSDPQVQRLLDAKKTLKWNYAPQGTSDRYGHAEALVDAPADKVAKVVSDFGHYRELHRKFATARVVGKEGDSTDVYMRYPVQIGRFTVEFHEVMRFGQPRQESGTHVVEGRGLKGDMKQGHTRIAVKPVDDKHSLLVIDVLLVPKIPAPQVLIDEELRDGAEDFVNGIKDRAQGRPGAVTAL